MAWKELKKNADKCLDLLRLKIKSSRIHLDMLKSNSQRVGKIISSWHRNMRMLLLIFKLRRSRLLDNQISIMPRHNKSKRWARNSTMLQMTREKCSKNQNTKFNSIKMKSIWENKTSKSLRKLTSNKTMILKCTNSDLNKWMKECKILKKNSSSSPVKTTDWETRWQI